MTKIKSDIGEMGPIQFRRSPRARHLNIRIKPYKGVQVSVPNGMSISAAEQFVLQKRDWIVRTLQKVKQLETDAIIYDAGVFVFENFVCRNVRGSVTTA